MSDPPQNPLSYENGLYRFERFPHASITDHRVKRLVTGLLRVVHKPWFAIWMPLGVAELTTVGRKSGLRRSTSVRAFRDGDQAYLVAIAGDHTLWLKNIRANPAVELKFRNKRFEGVARDPSNDAERQAIDRAFCQVHPFDYAENMFHRKGLPSRRKIIELHRAWLAGGTPLVVDIAG